MASAYIVTLLMMNDQESAPSAVRLRGETALRQVIGLFKSANGHQTPYEGQLLTSRTACWTWSRRALKAGISVPGPTLARCAAILAETATPETLNATLDTLLATYVRGISPDTQRKTRNCVRTLLAKFGDRAGIYLASMAGPEGMSVFGNDKEFGRMDNERQGQKHARALVVAAMGSGTQGRTPG